MAMAGEISENIMVSENTLDIDELAKFAVDEHNSKQNAMLKFQKVVHVKEQVASGKMYDITIEATKAGNNKDYYYYEAKILVKSWLNFKDKELKDFKYLGTTPDDGPVL